jgi:hypothetical protein
VKKLWLVTNIMVACGLVLAIGGAVLGFGPVALICGVLLVWSGIVKVVVLRVWKSTLPPGPPPRPARASTPSATALREPT